MQKKKNIEYTLIDFFFLIMCFLGAVVCLVLFRIDLNTTLSKQNEKHIAVITYKYKAAQRRFTDRVLWDRLRQHSPVYNGDILRTDADSEATISFIDNTADISMYENTIIQVFTGKKPSVEFSQGNIRIQTMSNFDVMTTSGTIQLAQGTSVSAGLPSAAGVLQVAVSSGAAELETADKKILVNSGETAELTETGTLSERPSLAVLYPPPVLRLANRSQDAFAVYFSFAAVSQVSPVIIETSPVSSFNQITSRQISADIETAVFMRNGTTWWRACFEDKPGVYVSGKVSLVYVPPLKQISPIENYRFNYRDNNPAVQFLWEGNDFASLYEVTVADNPDLINPVIIKSTPEPLLPVRQLGEGTWYWQVSASYPEHLRQSVEKTPVHQFIIEKKLELPPVEILTPLPEKPHALYENTNDMLFVWSPDAQASAYRLTISSSPSFENPVIKIDTELNYYRFENPDLFADRKLWYWNVVKLDAANRAVSPAQIHRFSVKKLTAAIEQLFPPDGYKVQAELLSDVQFTWKNSLKGENTLQISAFSDFSVVKTAVLTAENAVSLFALPEGIWYWRVNSQTESGFLESGVRKFSVITTPVTIKKDVVPEIVLPQKLNPPKVQPEKTVAVKARPVKLAAPFEAPKLLEPANDKVIDINELVSKKSIFFSWRPVVSAASYRFSITSQSDGKKLLEKTLSEPAYFLTDLTILDRGKFVWQVEAVGIQPDGKTARGGRLSKSVFLIELPDEKIKLKDVGTLYGR